MAPVTRSSVHGRAPAPALAPNQQSMQHQTTNEDFDMTEDQTSFHEDGDDFRESSNSVSPFLSAQDMLLPLQETANRVSRQVEDFAKALDKFKCERDVSDTDLWIEAVELLKRYTQITDYRKEKTAADARTGQANVDEQAKALKLESDLWTLTGNLLLCKCPETTEHAQETLENGMGKVHRYSTDRDLWELFLDSDSVAQEYETILDWLQEAAAESSPSLEDVVANLTTKSDRGDGIWSAGLIFTKDAIKKHKRSSAIPNPLEPSGPGASNVLVRDDDKAPLVTQMDPDAPVRQTAKLAVLDEYHEEAAWRICWEMLRRGMKAEEIRTWWSDRKESWRTALLLCTTNQNDQKTTSHWLRMMNLASNSEYLARCETASEKKSPKGHYEQAVYGILSGSHSATEDTWATMDDALYSYFNAVLIERWKQFLNAHQRTLESTKEKGYQPGSSSFSAIRDYLADAMQYELRDELHMPQRYIEAAIIGQGFEQFFIEQGHSAAQVAHMAKQSPLLMEKDTSMVHNDSARIAAQDQDAVRIIAHLQLVLRRLGFLDRAYRHNSYEMDNNIVNYIGFLERDAKYYLLPLYASQLAAERIPQVLGTVLINVTDRYERETQVKLMKLYDIDVPVVLFGIFSLANYHDLERLKSIKSAKHATKITEYVEAANTKTVKIRTGFMGDEPTESEERALLSIEWMRYLDEKSWDMAVSAVTDLYKLFLLSGQLTAARFLLQRANLAETSLSAVGMNLNVKGPAEEVSDDEDEDMEMENSAEIIEGRVQPVSPTRRRHRPDHSTHSLTRKLTNREELVTKSKVWAQLERLIDALWALERWQDFADEIESIRGNLAHMRTAKRELQGALNELTHSMNHILHSDFLTEPNDETEGKVLALIRNHYIPEAILGYNSALYFAGHCLTRNYLVECMNLAQEVAQNPMLTDAFVQSGRMRELVMAFALDSQALLRANEAGGGSTKPKKGKRDGTVGVQGKPDIWQITWKQEEEETGGILG